MEINYNKLWDICTERGISRSELGRLAGISTNAIAKLGKNEDVRVRILIRISEVLECKIDDFMEYGMRS